MNNSTLAESKIIDSLIEQSVDFHCHGVGCFNFTEIPEIDLEEIENILSQRKQRMF
jgi:hypothetical protein